MRPRVVATACLCLVLAVVGGVAVWQTWQAREPSAVRPKTAIASHPDTTPVVDPLELLRAWDARRSAAYADADLAALRRLYADGSVAGRRDLAVLRSYRSRGLRVVGLTTQLLDVRTEGRRDGEVVVRVTDRLAGALAVGAGRRVRLPAGNARTRLVTLVEDGRGWVVADVRADPAG